MNQPKVSIIMPSLNVRPFIEKCLASVCQQTLREIEIICVDAGSADGTLEVLEQAAQEDRRIQIIRSEMKSYGYQVNMGLRAARGKYIGIVETDDCIRPEMMERLYDLAAEQELDYVKADFSMFIERHGVMITRDCLQPLDDLGIEGRVIDTRECPQILYRDGYIWKGIYRRDFLLQNGLWLNETPGAAYQDNGFLHRTILHGRRVLYIPDSLYQYRRDNEASSDYRPAACLNMAREYEFIEQDRATHPELFEPFLNIYYSNMLRLCRAQMNMAEHYEDVEQAVEKYRAWLRSAFEQGLQPGSFALEEINLRLLLDNPRKLWEQTHWLEEIRDRAYGELLDYLSASAGDIVVVSCGDRGSCLYMLLARNLDTKDIWACDNNSALHGNICGYHPISSVEQAVARHPRGTFVIANEKYHWELRRQLLDLGVTNEQILVVNLPIWPHLASSWQRRTRS